MKNEYIISFPKINIRSKNELAKRIAGKDLSFGDALELVNIVLKNFDRLWYDSSRASKPEEGKFVRAAIKGSALDRLLKLINVKILSQYDELVPSYVFGGLKKRNHVGAAMSLVNGRKAVFLSFDIQKFFETIDSTRVESFLVLAGCSKRAASILSRICCVPEGAKNSLEKKKVLARGFATSSRLALWCSLGNMIKIKRLLSKYINLEPKLAIYVDDIGVSLSGPSDNEIKEIQLEIIRVIETSDPRINLSVHKKADKLKVQNISSRPEHLKILLGKGKIAIGSRTRGKIARIKLKRKYDAGKERVKIKNVARGLRNYKKQISKANIASRNYKNRA
jgi:hypothetical protein